MLAAGGLPLVGAVALALLAAPSARAEERLCTETLVPTSDGVKLHAWVSRLAPDRARPVLFMMDSYARQGKPGQGPQYNNACPEVLPDDGVPGWLSVDVINRFTLVQVSYRGTGSSEGLFDLTGRRTQRDIREAIAWAARQPWGNGDIVAIGESGTGFFAHHALLEPHVRAAVIYTSCADMYRCFYRGGQYNGLAEVYFAATSAGYLGGLDARNRLGTNRNPDPAQQLAALTQASARTTANPVNDGWWQERSSLESLRDVSIPVMYTTDLYDIVQPFDAVQLTPDARLNLGMGHLSADAIAAGGSRYTRLVRTPVDRFVARYGLGEPNGAERDPRVTLTTNTGSVGDFRAGRVLVRQETEWPLAGTAWTRLHLAEGGALTPRFPSAPGAADTAALASAGNADLRTAGWLLGNRATDLSTQERTGLTYTTPVLRRNLEVTGPISLRLFASSTAPDFDWAVRLTDVWPDGRSEWITDGYLRASLRKVDPRLSLRDDSGAIVRPWLTYDWSEPAPVGQPVEYLVDVIATSNVFRAGHRLRLDILPVASAEPDSARTGGAGIVTVLHDPAHPSSMSLPVIPNRCGRGTPLAPDAPRIESCAMSFGEAVGGNG